MKIKFKIREKSLNKRIKLNDLKMRNCNLTQKNKGPSSKVSKVINIPQEQYEDPRNSLKKLN